MDVADVLSAPSDGDKARCAGRDFYVHNVVSRQKKEL